jgi:hypothetical protein
VECPAEWEKMRLTSEPTVRFCGSCNKHVYYCSTLQEVRKHVGPGHCVAIDSSLERQEGDTRRRVPGFPSRSFFFPEGTLVSITGGEHAGRQGVVQVLFERLADVRVPQGEGFMVVRVPLGHMESLDGSPTWGHPPSAYL